METKRPKQRSFRPSLHLELTNLLREMILKHELPPGQWIPEAELCDSLGVSRTPLREALKVIAAEKLVLLHPNRGATVADLLPEDVDHMFEAQSIIESAAARLACLRATEDEVSKFRKIHGRMVRFFEKRDRKEYFALNQNLHRMIVAMSHNPTLIETHSALMMQMERARYLALDIGHRWEDSVTQHEAILSALEKRDGTQIQTLVRDHVLETQSTVRRAVEERLAGAQAPVASSRPYASRKTRTR